jgi:hypothetical protein
LLNLIERFGLTRINGQNFHLAGPSFDIINYLYGKSGDMADLESLALSGLYSTGLPLDT